jgi:O-antigen/teichoic acid export membrane protein
MKHLLSRFNWSYLYAILGEGTLALTFVLYVLLARVLGPETYEIFAAAVALGAILSLFMQFGFPTLINREVAANPIEGSKLTVEFLLIQLIFAAIVAIALWPVAKTLGFEGKGAIVCYLVLLSEVDRGVKMTLRSVLRGKGWFRTETISVAIERSAVVVVALFVLFQTKNLIWVVTSIVIVRSLDIIGLFWFLSSKTRIYSRLSLKQFQQSIRRASPFAVSGILWILYYQVDVVMLKAIGAVGQAGFYSAAYRVMEIFSALPRAVFYVIFTQLTRCHANTPQELPQEIYKTTRLLLLVVFPAILMAGFAQKILINLLYGDRYSASVDSLAILIPSISINMFATLAERLLQATGREKSLPPLLLTTAIVNLGINAILIPFLGGRGAAIATLLSELILCILGLILIGRMGYKQLAKNMILLVAISLLMASIPSLMLYQIISVSVGAIVLFLGAIALVVRMRPRYFVGHSPSGEVSS